MKKFTVLLIFLCLIIACKKKTNVSDNVTMEKDLITNKIDDTVYIEKIDSISNKVIDLTNPRVLLRNKSFMEIYENPKIYKDNALHVLSSSDEDEQSKEIAIWSMQKLDLVNYITFTQESFLLFKNDILSERCLMFIITSPGFDKSFIMARNFKNKEVKELLNQIKNCEKISPESRLSISHIISGKYWRRIR